MKKLLFALLLVISATTFSQENYTFKSGGRIFDSNNKKLKPDSLRVMFKENTEFLKLYNAGRSKKTIGNVLLLTGTSTLIIKYISDINKPNESLRNGEYPKQKSNVLYFVAGGLIVVAIPIKIGYSKKIKKSVEVLNSNNKSIGYINSSFIMNTNGFGLKIQF